MIDTPGLAGDLWANYRLAVDRLESPGMVRVLLECVGALRFSPNSLSRVYATGNPLTYGWGSEASAVASVVEEVRILQSIVAAAFSKKAPDVERYQGRPEFYQLMVERETDMFSAFASLGLPVTRQ